MIRTIEIGNKEVRLSNNISWAMIYKDQFGHDIVSSLTPMLAAGLDLISGFLSDVDTSKPIDAVDLLKRIDGDVLNANETFGEQLEASAHDAVVAGL